MPTDLEISRNDVELLPCQGHTFDEGMFLVFQRQHCLEENHAFILCCKHTHKGLHEVLSEQDVSVVVESGKVSWTYSYFIPDIIITFEHCQMVLDGDYETVTRHKFFKLSTRKIDSCTHCDDGSFWRRVVFSVTKKTRC